MRRGSEGLWVSKKNAQENRVKGRVVGGRRMIVESRRPFGGLLKFRTCCDDGGGLWVGVSKVKC